jgi:hypothetical protein
LDFVPAMHIWGGGDLVVDALPDPTAPDIAPDTTPPETTISKGAPNRTAKTRVQFKFSSSEPGSSFECKHDQKAFKPCGAPKNLRRLDAGKHRFKVRAIDAAGNVDPSAAKDRFKVVDPPQSNGGGR